MFFYKQGCQLTLINNFLKKVPCKSAILRIDSAVREMQKCIFLAVFLLFEFEPKSYVLFKG